MIGEKLSHYQILEKLGEGGMGEVYLAEDSKLERKVALKVLPPEMAESRERLERFEREAKAIAALNHPNIVHVYSVEEDQSIHFLTMELVDGDTLNQEIPPQGLPLERFFNLAIPLADALAEAHEQGIVHRDLKPANIMVDRKGRPKILDFGLAKLRQPETSENLSQLPTEVMTQEGRVLGTYPYMSPEQIEGKSVDHRSDLFSLGSVLYEMATGQRPFTGDSPASLMSAILRDAPSAADIERPELPHHLGRIIGRCLEKEAENRYQRAKDLEKDLEELRQEVQTGVAPASRPVARPAASWSWGLRAGLGVLALLVVGVVLYMTQPWETTIPPIPEPRITSLAVLPLENLSGDPEQDYYAAGITEGLVSELGRVGSLRVISRRSVLRYQNSNKTLAEIAAELGVEALIEGSVLPAGDRVRVTAQLIQVDPEQQLWAEAYERDAKDILKLLRELTGAIVGEVQIAVSPGDRAPPLEAREVDPEAHRLYLKALEAESFGTPEEWPKAAGYLRQALQIDPGFAEAWVQLAKNSAWMAILYLPASMEAERVAAIEEMNEALEMASKLDRSSSRLHSVQGFVDAYLDWDWARAEQEHLKAIELNPNSSTAHIYYAELLAVLGRFEEAFDQVALADELDPFSVEVLLFIADIQYWAHDYEASLRYLDRAWELSPGFIDNLYYRARAFGALGREQEAVQAWQQMHSLLGNFQLAAAFEGLPLDEMYRTLLDFLQSQDEPFFGPGDIAPLYGELGEKERALELLEEAFSTHLDPGKNAGHKFIFLKVDPAYEELHSDPRFRDLLERMSLAD